MFQILFLFQQLVKVHLHDLLRRANPLYSPHHHIEVPFHLLLILIWLMELIFLEIDMVQNYYYNLLLQ